MLVLPFLLGQVSADAVPTGSANGSSHVHGAAIHQEQIKDELASELALEKSVG